MGIHVIEGLGFREGIGLRYIGLIWLLVGNTGRYGLRG